LADEKKEASIKMIVRGKPYNVRKSTKELPDGNERMLFIDRLGKNVRSEE